MNQESIQTWNKLAKLYAQKFMPMRCYDFTYDFFLDSLGNRTCKVLDVGCGPGIISKYLVDKNPSIEIVGIDSSIEMISTAKSLVESGNFLEMDAREIAKIEETLDGIICGFCVPYLNEQEVKALFKDMFGRLKNKGIGYVSFVQGDYSESRFIVGCTGDSLFFHFYEQREMKSWIESFGFKCVKIMHVEYGETKDQHVVMVFEKP